MNHPRRTLGVLLAATAALLGVLFAGPLSAHTGTSPVVTCSQASVTLARFPAGTHTISFEITVGATTTTRTATFTGTSGTATVSISDLTTATGPLTISAQASWTDDDGGSTSKTTVIQTCHEVPPTTQPSTTTTTVGPAPAASAVVTVPFAAKFTG